MNKKNHGTLLKSLKKKAGSFKKATLALIFIVTGGLVFVYAGYLFFLVRELPSVESLKNYKPPLITTVLDREGNKVGEFFKERRILVSYSEFPKSLIQAFVSAEDGRFFEHKGVNFKAIFRAFLANLRAGKKVQGGSTITQQVARSLLLSSEKTYKRKLKEAILAMRIEKHLSKEDILYLYLNQIYLGHGAYGVGMAAEIYFRKKVKDLTIMESSLLAGLPQAPSRFSPIYNPKKAKERQVYVLQRMVEESYISSSKAEEIKTAPLKVFSRGKYHEKAPYYLETVRQLLLKKIDEELLLTGGLTIKTAMQFSLQKLARKSLKAGLRELDKRQGFRGPIATMEQESLKDFFKKEEEKLIEKRREFRIIGPLEKNLIPQKKGREEKGMEKEEEKHLKGIRPGEIFKAWVKEVDDENEQVLVQLPFQTQGVLPLENMKWARKPDPKVSFKFFSLKKPSIALKKGDLIWVRAEENKEGSLIPADFEGQKTNPKEKASEKSPRSLVKKILVSLEQEPVVEGALLAFDQKTGDILALVGGYDFNRSQFNRAYQAGRQTGSVFKPIVYLSALDKGFTPATLITDAPVVYEEEEAEEMLNPPQAEDTINQEEEEEESKTWKPDNYGRRFSGDILFRNALIRSMNVPTVKVIEKIGVGWVRNYAQRLGLFSPLNPDYTLALGSSSVTLYEMTKVFSILGRGGKKIIPLLLYEVGDQNRNPLLGPLSLDDRFLEELEVLEKTMEEKRQIMIQAEKEQEQKKQHEQKKEDPPSLNSSAETRDPKESSPPPSFPSFFFSDPEQVISKQTAFIMTTLLKAVIREPQGTAYSAREMDWPLAGKTGTTNGYYDAWFLGYSPQIAVGVWVGFDDEKSLGRGETGARSALPIWLNFMKSAHTEELEKKDFETPEDIVFTYIDNETGGLVSSRSREIVHQAFLQGTQPKAETEFNKEKEEEDQDFLREDFSR